MHAVGREGERDVGSVVHDEERAVALGRLAEDGAPPQEVAGLRLLLPQLDDVRARREDRLQELGQVAPVLARARHHVQPRPCQSRASFHPKFTTTSCGA